MRLKLIQGTKSITCEKSVRPVYILPPTGKPESGKMLPPEFQIEFKVPPKKTHQKPLSCSVMLESYPPSTGQQWLTLGYKVMSCPLPAPSRRPGAPSKSPAASASKTPTAS